MGNQPEHEMLKQELCQLQTVKKFSQYSVLKNKQGKQYLKFLYVGSREDYQVQQLKTSKNYSIFNSKYLEYRYNSQNLQCLPKVVVFGEETQDTTMISCSANKINFVIFQHPTTTLKQYVEDKLISGHLFEQADILNLIQSVVVGLTNFYNHVRQWNQQVLEKKNLILTDQNVFFNEKLNTFMVSDVFSNLNDIESLLKQEVTLKRTSRSSSLSNLHARSLTNLHSKLASKKIKERYFQRNFSNLALIIEGIIFKFQCFSQPCKTSMHQSQSLSTALQSHRFNTKQNSLISGEIQSLVKQLQSNFTNQYEIIQNVNRLINETKFIQNEIPANINNEYLKLNATTSLLINLQRKNIFQEFKQNNVKVVDQNIFSNVSLLPKPRNDEMINAEKISKITTKFRLSLKKDCRKPLQQVQNHQNIYEVSHQLNRKSSYPKFMCIKNSQKITLKAQKAMQLHKIAQNVNGQQKNSQQKRSQSLNINFKKSSLIQKKFQCLKPIQQKKQVQKKKVFLKRQNTVVLVEQISKNGFTRIEQKRQQQNFHLNPITRKRNLGLNRNNLMKNKQNLNNFKTVEKGENEGIDIELIQNLSSIISNHNNTLSSYGNPLTDQFKTDNSFIEEQGAIGFNQIMQSHQSAQLSKKHSNQITDNSASVKLSSYPSIELVQSIIERPEEKIPQFLKKYNLPDKHLMALNNIILKQKDMIVQQSFQQSQFNSIRHSVPNILALEEDLNQLQRKKQQKMNFQVNSQFSHTIQTSKNSSNQNQVKKQSQQQFSIQKEATHNQQQKQSILYMQSIQLHNTSISRELKSIQFSLINI